MNNRFIKNSIISFFVISLLFGAQLALAANPYPGLKESVVGTGLESRADILAFVGLIIKSILSLLGVVLVIVVIYAGIMWGFLSTNDPKKIQTAKEMIKNAVIGLIIVLAAYTITNFVMRGISSAALGTVNTTF